MAATDLSASNSSNIVAIEEETEIEKFDKHGFLRDPLELEAESICNGLCFKVNETVTDVTDKTSIELRHLIKKGVPRSLRCSIWKNALKINEIKEKAKDSCTYQEFISKLNNQLQACQLTYEDNLSTLVENIDLQLNYQDDLDIDYKDFLSALRQILMDIDRTFPNHKMFVTGSANQLVLFRILAIYYLYNTTIGYCQGMAYILALLLMNLHDEETTFWCFASLLDSHDHYYLFFDKSLKKVKLLSEILSLMIDRRYPELGKHLRMLGIHSLMYSTQWFMCLFTCLNCWDTVLFIADLFISEGIHQLLNAALAIMELCQPELLVMSRLDQVLPFLQNIPARLIHRKLMKPLITSNSAFSSVIDLKGYWLLAEQNIEKEEITLEKRKQDYLQKSSRKRKHDLTDTSDVPTTPSLLSKLVNVFTPAKRSKLDEVSTETPVVSRKNKTARNNLATPSLTTSINHSTGMSLKKGCATLHYSPDTGLIYTSPNTIEMKNLTANTVPKRNAISKCGEPNKEAIKLSFDSPSSVKDSPLIHQVKTVPRRSPRIAKRRQQRELFETKLNTFSPL